MYRDKGLTEVSGLKNKQGDKRFSGFDHMKPPHLPEFPAAHPMLMLRKRPPLTPAKHSEAAAVLVVVVVVDVDVLVLVVVVVVNCQHALQLVGQQNGTRLRQWRNMGNCTKNGLLDTLRIYGDSGGHWKFLGLRYGLGAEDLLLTYCKDSGPLGFRPCLGSSLAAIPRGSKYPKIRYLGFGE